MKVVIGGSPEVEGPTAKHISRCRDQQAINWLHVTYRFFFSMVWIDQAAEPKDASNDFQEMEGMSYRGQNNGMECSQARYRNSCNFERGNMPQSPHERIAELHNLASHAHTAAAAAHDKGDSLTGHELSRQALEHSQAAYHSSEEAKRKGSLGQK